MAASAPCMSDEIEQVLNSTVANMPAIESINLVCVDSEICVWVGLSEDSSSIRSSIYAVEDSLADRFPGMYIEFRVFQIPTGRTMEDFVSESKSVYKRPAA